MQIHFMQLTLSFNPTINRPSKHAMTTYNHGRSQDITQDLSKVPNHRCNNMSSFLPMIIRRVHAKDYKIIPCNLERVTITTGQGSLRATIDFSRLASHPSFPWDSGMTLCGKKTPVDRHKNQEIQPRNTLL